MLRTIRIKNLRAITDLTIDGLEQVNLFVGDNNCGKTTLLEGLFFLIGASNPILPVTANRFRGLRIVGGEVWAGFFNNMDLRRIIEISSILRESNEEQNLLIYPEMEKAGSSKTVGADVVEFAPENGDSKAFLVPEGLRLEFKSSKDPHTSFISTIRQKGSELVPTGQRDRLPRGIYINPFTISDWADRFDSVQRKKQLPEVISAIRKIEPTISDLRLSKIGVLQADIGLSELIPINLMGGGIVRFLSIALAMLDSRDGIVLVDEIETGFQRKAQDNLWRAVFAWAQDLNVQVFATTHSYECIRAFSSSAEPALFPAGAKLYRIERSDEGFKATGYSKGELAESLESNWEVR